VLQSVGMGRSRDRSLGKVFARLTVTIESPDVTERHEVVMISLIGYDLPSYKLTKWRDI